MNEIKNALSVENMIYEIRGKQVMLDSDLAKLYQCTNGTKTINQAVGRHRDRFPDDFYFQLTTEEYSDLKSQLGTSSLNEYGIKKSAGTKVFAINKIDDLKIKELLLKEVKEK